MSLSGKKTVEDFDMGGVRSSYVDAQTGRDIIRCFLGGV
jgi:hypothetical protein